MNELKIINYNNDLNIYTESLVNQIISNNNDRALQWNYIENHTKISDKENNYKTNTGIEYYYFDFLNYKIITNIPKNYISNYKTLYEFNNFGKTIMLTKFNTLIVINNENNTWLLIDDIETVKKYLIDAIKVHKINNVIESFMNENKVELKNYIELINYEHILSPIINKNLNKIQIY